MIKMLLLLSAKPGMARDDFIARYESDHVGISLERVPFYHEYRRNFLQPESMVAVSHVGPAAQRPQFDVVTQLWFRDQAALDAMQQEMAETDAGEAIADDERQQFDRTRMLMLLADEYVTPANRLMPPPDGPDMIPAVKMICTMRKRADMSREEFIQQYETGHAETAMRTLVDDQGRCVFGQYRRSFPRPETITQIGDADAASYIYDFDVMTEIWFRSMADYNNFHQLSTNADIARIMQEDEAKLFDMRHTVMFLVDEHITPPDQCAAAHARLMARKAA